MVENDVSNGKTVADDKDQSRRGFVRKIVSVAALGGLGALLLGRQSKKASAVGAANQIAYYTGPDAYAGSDHLKWYDSDRNFVAGYSGNTVTTGATGATISGGGDSGYENKVTDNYGTVGGGYRNRAGNNDTTVTNAAYATVGGGQSNWATGKWSTIGGGDTNLASSSYATVGGGGLNTASWSTATVGGGAHNSASQESATVGGGYGNTASGANATVAGGIGNTASGLDATVPGGIGNVAAGDFSFAAGRRAKIDEAHDGAFLFADQNDFDFNSTAANEFAVRATGGARFVTAIDGSGNPTQTISMTPSGNLGVGTTAPVRQIHLQGGNACFRMDRNTNSSAFILVRTALGDFNTVWKTFYVGVDANGVNDGSLFIGDVGTNVAGPSTKRLVIDNNGNVGVGTETPTALLDVNSNVFRVRSSKTPATAGAAGNPGDICWDSNYIYVCVATNTWKRAALSSW